MKERYRIAIQNRHVSSALSWLSFVSVNAYSPCLYTRLECLSCPAQESVLRPVPLKGFLNDLTKKVDSEDTKSSDNTKLFRRRRDNEIL